MDKTSSQNNIIFKQPKESIVTFQAHNTNRNNFLLFLAMVSIIAMAAYDLVKKEEVSLVFNHFCTAVSFAFMLRAIPPWLALGRALKAQKETGVAQPMPVFSLSLCMGIALFFNQLPVYIF